jgi:hypothetical protein
MPKSALPQAPSKPDQVTRTMVTSGRGRQQDWRRRALVIFLLILITGIVPTVLMGELLGWWIVSRSVPYVVPR